MKENMNSSLSFIKVSLVSIERGKDRDSIMNVNNRPKSSIFSDGEVCDEERVRLS